MSEPAASGAAIESPCVNICVIHPGAGLCIGCLRTGDEISRWSAMTPQARRALMDALPARGPLLDAAGPPPAARTAARSGARRRK